MSGSQLSGIATASSTAAPKLRLSPLTAAVPRPRKITTLSTMVSRNSAAMATVFSLPRFCSPMSSQTTMSAPISRHQTQRPAANTPSAASAPS